MIDCHNHILPGIDDGAHDDTMSVAMARVAVENGIDTIVCTPHHMNGVYTNYREAVFTKIEQLRQVLAAEQLALTLVPGSELHLVPEIPQMVLDERALTYGDHKCAALVELPKQTVPSGTFDHLRALVRDGVAPVIAHPERNAELARAPDKLLEWVQAGCKVQLTGQSVSGDFGATIQRVCDYWIDKQCVHLVASDAHRPHGRKPDLSAALTRVATSFGDAVATTLFVDNPAHLVNGADLVQAPKPKRTFSSSVTRARAKFGWW